MKLPPSIADTYDQQPTPTPMTRLEAIEYIVSRTDFDYPETPFRRRDPYTVTASEISQMTDNELRDYTKALQIVEIFEATELGINCAREGFVILLRSLIAIAVIKIACLGRLKTLYGWGGGIRTPA